MPIIILTLMLSIVKGYRTLWELSVVVFLKSLQTDRDYAARLIHLRWATVIVSIIAAWVPKLALLT